MKYLRDEESIRSFGHRLRIVRIAKGYTQEKLADESGIEHSQVSRIERGVINTSLSVVFLLAKTLQVDVRELFDFSDQSAGL